MRTVYVIFLWAICFFAAHGAHAHALWLETSQTGKQGKAQQVRIYYGEPSDGVVDKVTDWWSDVGSFTLWLYLPDGTRQQLPVEAQADHYSATFVPAQAGLYTLRIDKPVTETFDGHQYQFNSTALVSVGKDTGSGHTLLGEEFRLFADVASPKKTGTSIEVLATLDGQPVAKQEVTVFSPNGWSKTFHTDDNGRFAFVPDRKGDYLVEALHSSAVENGAIKHLHRISTGHITVN